MAQGQHINVHLGSLAALAYVGIFPSFLATFFLQQGNRRGRPQQGQPVHPPDAGFGTLLSFLFLGEVPLWYHYTGIALIFSGIWLTMKR